MLRLPVVLPRGHEREGIATEIVGATAAVAERIGQRIEVAISGVLRERGLRLRDEISAADVVVADVSGSWPDAMYEVGFAHGHGIPTVLISERTARPVPSDLRDHHCLLHSRTAWTRRFGRGSSIGSRRPFRGGTGSSRDAVAGRIELEAPAPDA